MEILNLTPTQTIDLIQQWAIVLVTVFSGVVTGASILVRILVSYIRYSKELNEHYEPGPFLIMILSLFQALAYNSKSAFEISEQVKQKKQLKNLTDKVDNLTIDSNGK